MEPKKFGGRGARARRQKVGYTALCNLFNADNDSLTDKRLLFGFLALPSYTWVIGGSEGEHHSLRDVYHDIAHAIRSGWS